MREINKTGQPLKLIVGPYSIRISVNETYLQNLNLPVNVHKFADTGDSDESELIFHYIIKNENYRIEAEDVLMDGLDKGPVPYKVYQKSSGEYLWLRQNAESKVSLAYYISDDWRYWRLIADESGTSGKAGFNELAYIFPYSILSREGILFHGVVMEWNGLGIIVGAHSGTGKTTHSRMWRDNENALILNGDRALCFRKKDEWYTGGAPWSGSSGECQNRNISLSVIVILEQSSENQVSCLSPFQGALELIKLAFAPAWERSLMNYSLDSIDHIVRKVPVLKLSCRPDLDAVRVLKEEIIKMVEIAET